MKNRIVSAVLVALSFFLVGFSHPVHAESIKSFDSTLVIEKTGEVSIQEKIVYDFGSEYRHGIYRSIPYQYKNPDGLWYEADIFIQSVQDEMGRNVQFTSSRSGGDMTLRIGDPDKTITGTHTYVISYGMSGLVQQYSDHLELNWNAVGPEWEVPITSARATVFFDPNVTISPSEIDVGCRVGIASLPLGTGCVTNLQSDRAVFSSTVPIVQGQNFQIIESFPLGTVTYIPLTHISEPNAGPPDWVWLLILLWGFLANTVVPAFFIYQWWRTGRDPQETMPQARTFEPPKNGQGRILTPLEIGALADEVIQSRDISAEIIHLAVQKYLVIHEGERKLAGLMPGDIEFKRGPAYAEDPELQQLAKHQKTLYQALTLDTHDSVKVKDLKDDLHQDLKSLKDDLYKQMVTDGYFPEDPEARRNKYYIWAFVSLIFMGFFTSGILFIIARSMGRKTLAGVNAMQQAKGLKEFLVSQERQYAFQEKEKFMFEQLLPYAIVFGVAKIWAKKFEQFTDYVPEWYEGSSQNFANTYLLTSHLESKLSSNEGSYTPTSSSSSSGFSSGFSGGGGFGGGGGGSW